VTSSVSALTSGIYKGNVRHRRFTPKTHRFDYGLYMLSIDLDEIDETNKLNWLGFKWFNPLRLKASDHFKCAFLQEVKQPQDGELTLIKRAVIEKANGLLSTNGNHFNVEQTQVVMVSQARCFGVYFSPINFYFLTSKEHNAQFMLAEVSNTPWNQTHYYLIEMQQSQRSGNEKQFHVSPFMPMNMRYEWNVRPPTKNMLVHIENWLVPNSTQEKEHKVFDATMNLKRHPLNNKELSKLLIQMPLMTCKIMLGIYWQATKLFIKRIPFIGHPQSS
jgi:uncharacterized protein